MAAGLRRHLGLAIVFSVALVGLLVTLNSSQPRLRAGGFDSVDEALSRVSRYQTVPSGEPLSVARSSPAKWILGDGFLTPDTEGSWLAQTEGVIRFASATGDPVSLEIHMTPLLGRESPTRDVVVTSTIDRVDFTLTGGPVVVFLALDGNSQQDIRFWCSDIDSPQGLEINPDQRRFCFKLLSVQVNSE